MTSSNTASLSRARPLMGTLVSVQVWPDTELRTATQLREWTQAIAQALACVAQIARAMLPLPSLEVRGQVNRLLKEATSDLNLFQMYVGWMPML